MLKAEAPPILWPPDVKNWLIRKDLDAMQDWRQEEKGMTEDEIVGWYHQLNGHEFEQALGVGDGQGSLVCCSPWGRKELGTTEWQLNWTELNPFEIKQFKYALQVEEIMKALTEYGDQLLHLVLYPWPGPPSLPAKRLREPKTLENYQLEKPTHP